MFPIIDRRFVHRGGGRVCVEEHNWWFHNFRMLAGNAITRLNASVRSSSTFIRIKCKFSVCRYDAYFEINYSWQGKRAHHHFPRVWYELARYEPALPDQSQDWEMLVLPTRIQKWRIVVVELSIVARWWIFTVDAKLSMNLRTWKILGRGNWIVIERWWI